MPSIDHLTPALASLLARPTEEWSLLRLWRGLPAALRREIAEAAIDPGHEDEHLRRAVLTALADAAGFREETLRSVGVEEAARHVQRLTAPRAGLLGRALSHFLRHRRRDLLETYLDATGLEHEGGILVHPLEGPIDAGAARFGAEALRARFPFDDVALYLVGQRIWSPELVPGLDEWARAALVQGRQAESEAPADREVSDAPEPGVIREAREAAREEEAPRARFSALDRALVKAIVATSQGIEGSMSPAEVEDMVEELLSLTASRHRSFFHRGFADFLLGRGWRDVLSAENEPARRWYLAGWVSGLARRGDDAAIAALHDERPDVRASGSGETPPDRIMVPPVFNALCRVGRPAEAAGFLSVAAVREDPALMRELLNQGTRLLRLAQPETARPVFDLLGDVVRSLEEDGEPVTERFFLEIRRRRAHCYRQLGEAERARELLERLLREDPDPDVQAMVQADLGLLDGGYRTLTEVRLWRTPEERERVRGRLERGAERFRAAAGLESRHAAHGAWPLGVLALARGEWDAAGEYGSRALPTFEANRARYAQEELVGQVRLGLGLSLALNLDPARQSQARDRIVEGIRAGGAVPIDLLADVLAALDAGDRELGGDVLAALLDAGQDQALDVLAASDAAGRNPRVAEALMERAADESRRGRERAADLRTAVELLLSGYAPDRARAIELAREALDRLEVLAREGRGRESFIDLLSRPETLDPAWLEEDARWSRLQLLEMEAAFEEAINEGRRLFHGLLAAGDADALDEAEALLDRFRRYPVEREWTRDLEDRLAAIEREEEEPLPRGAPHEVLSRIVIVGGDERNRELLERVEQKLGPDADHLRIQHITTGWSANWALRLEEVLRACDKADGVVILRYIRTEFGRSLRAALEIPWVACPGVGTAQVARAVKRVARWSAAAKGP